MNGSFVFPCVEHHVSQVAPVVSHARTRAREHALHRPLQRCCIDSPDFLCDLVLQLGQCLGVSFETFSFQNPQRKKSGAVRPFGLLSHDIHFENKARLPECARKQSISFL